MERLIDIDNQGVFNSLIEEGTIANIERIIKDFRTGRRNSYGAMRDIEMVVKEYTNLHVTVLGKDDKDGT